MIRSHAGKKSDWVSVWDGDRHSMPFSPARRSEGVLMFVARAMIRATTATTTRPIATGVMTRLGATRYRIPVPRKAGTSIAPLKNHSRSIHWFKPKVLAEEPHAHRHGEEGEGTEP